MRYIKSLFLQIFKSIQLGGLQAGGFFEVLNLPFHM